MNMRPLFTSVLCLTLSSSAMAQQESPQPEQQLRVFRLEYSLPSELAEELVELQPEAISLQIIINSYSNYSSNSNNFSRILILRYNRF